MGFDGIGRIFRKQIELPRVEPPPPPRTQDQDRGTNTKIGEVRFIGDQHRADLERTYQGNNRTPATALEEIRNIPRPNSNDSDAVAEYKTQVAEIAENAIENAQRPSYSDFEGLPPRVADLEYSDAIGAYNTTISELEEYSEDAANYPEEILTPRDAINEIEDLIVPDRNDPEAIQEYNRQRADIADRALLYAEPPNGDDYNDSLPPPSDVQGYYQNIDVLNEASSARYIRTPPPLTDAEVETAAQNLIDNNGGANNEDEAYAVGRNIAEVAQDNPEDAAVIMQRVQEKLNDTDFGDNVASGFVNNISDADLEKVAGAPNGRDVLTDLNNRLLSGSVHGDEVNEAQRLVQAVVNSDNNLAATTFTTPGGIPANPDGYFTTPGTEVPEVTGQAIHDEDPFFAKDMYLQAIEIHKDDPQWLSTFYRTLGTDKTAELINNTANSLPPPTEEQRQLVGQSLQSLVEGGYATQADIDSLVTQAISSDDGSLHRGTLIFLSEAISGLPNDEAGVELKNMFSSATARIATGELPAAINNDYDLDEARNILAATATHVISTTPESNQTQQLAELQNILGEDKFDNLINRALNSEEGLFDPITRQPLENYDGMGILLKSIGNDPTVSQDFRLHLFDITTEALAGNSEVYDKYSDDIDFKDGLSSIYLKDFDTIFINNISENGASISGDTPWLTSFFELTLFSQPPSSQASDVLATTYERIASIAKASDLIGSGKQPLTTEEQALVDSFYEWSPRGEDWTPDAAAGVIGEWMGAIDKAYQFAVEDIEGDAAANRAVLDVFIGAADKLTGLAKTSPGAGLARDVLFDGLNRYAEYREGEQISDGKAKIETTASVIKDLNNLIWDTIYEPSQQKYSSNFEHITGHEPTENVLGG